MSAGEAGISAPGKSSVARLLQASTETRSTTAREILVYMHCPPPLTAPLSEPLMFGHAQANSLEILALEADPEDARPLFRVSQGLLSSVLQLRSQHISALKDVLAVNRAMELRLCDTTEKIAFMQASNDITREATMRARQHRGSEVTTTASSAATGPPLAEAEALLLRLRTMETATCTIQRVWRGWLGRRLVVQVALAITNCS